MAAWQLISKYTFPQNSSRKCAKFSKKSSRKCGKKQQKSSRKCELPLIINTNMLQTWLMQEFGKRLFKKVAYIRFDLLLRQLKNIAWTQR